MTLPSQEKTLIEEQLEVFELLPFTTSIQQDSSEIIYVDAPDRLQLKTTDNLQGDINKRFAFELAEHIGYDGAVVLLKFVQTVVTYAKE